jgi:glycosyltransferase involved in cell wall biosynthesis
MVYQDPSAPAQAKEDLVKAPVSVVLITYNRADLLVNTFSAIKAAIDACGLEAEYILCDDGSTESHRKILDALPVDRRLMAPRNQGLGANCNKGLAAARYKYILQIQDDTEFCGQPEALLRALEILHVDRRVGVVQLSSSMEAKIKEEICLSGGSSYVVFDNDGMPVERPCGLRPYSDQPHLKRREFCDDVGPYREDMPMTKMELEYQRRVANQERWYVAAPKEGVLFRHTGEGRTFNPSIKRAERIQLLERIPALGPILRFMRGLARRIRDALRGTEH